MPFQRYSTPITCWYSRLSFPHIWEPSAIIIQGQVIGEPRYSVKLILHDEVAQRITAIENELIAKSWPQWSNQIPPAGVILRNAMARGETNRPGDPYLAGKWVMNAYAKKESKPWVVKKDAATGNYLPVTDQTLVYAGCEAHVSVGLYTTQIQASEPQINVGLNGLELTGRSLPSFENRTTAEQALDGGPDIGAPPQPGADGGITPPGCDQSENAPADSRDPLKYLVF